MMSGGLRLGVNPLELAVEIDGNDLGCRVEIALPCFDRCRSLGTSNEKNIDRHNHFKGAENDVHLSVTDFVFGNVLHEDWQGSCRHTGRLSDSNATPKSGLSFLNRTLRKNPERKVTFA